jgi:predicted transcriptional regulator
MIYFLTMPRTSSEAQTGFVERAGLLTEREGLPRIAGRIFGLLLLEPAELSLDEIAERLSVSRASVSTDARRLEQIGILERVGRLGDRRSYYRLAPCHHVRSVERHLHTIRELIALYEDALRIPPATTGVGDRIERSILVLRDIDSLLTDALARWRADARVARPSHSAGSATSVASTSATSEASTSTQAA